MENIIDYFFLLLESAYMEKSVRLRKYQAQKQEQVSIHFLSKERTCAKKEYNSFGKAFLPKKRFVE